MSRHIKLEIFDDAERCQSVAECCLFLERTPDDNFRWCGIFQCDLQGEHEALRCPECKAAEVKL